MYFRERQAWLAKVQEVRMMNRCFYLILAFITISACSSFQSISQATRVSPTIGPEPQILLTSSPSQYTPKTTSGSELKTTALLDSTWREAISPDAMATKRQLQSLDMPDRDLIDLTFRLRDPGQLIQKVVRDEPWGFEVGDSHEFWVLNWDNHQYFQVTAHLVYETAHAYLFVEEGVDLGEDQLKRAADRFESQTYPTNRRIFGEEWSPGVDADPHLVILFARNMGDGIGGYQNSLDEFSHLVNEYSNEMEIIYQNAEDVRLGDPEYDCLLAHEFAHAIQWAMDPNEATWLNEGFAVLACQINGFNTSGIMEAVDAFAQKPDTQLNTWSGEADAAYADYGASYLFTAYLFDRFGEETIHALAADQAYGLDGLDHVISILETDRGVDDVFADWVVANFINDTYLEDGRYSYMSLEPPSFIIQDVYNRTDLPVERLTCVGQYATDYVVLHGEGNFRVDFAGETLVRLAALSAHSGKYVWWGGRVNNGDVTLTKEFDLTNLQQATLTFYTWYDIEKDNNFAYVEVSEDGEHWKTLPGRTTTSADPNGVNYGYGFTSSSDGWIEEQINLTPFVGQKVQIRFEYVTDDGPIRDGIFLDDIEIPELGYRYDAEEGDGGWEARGFMRNAILLPQEWLLQLVTQKQDVTTVERLQLNSANKGQWIVDLDSDETAAFVISGSTRGTTEPAEYWYAITPDDE